MTRFARATGSRSSNVREPEAATPWAELVRQVKEARDSQGVEDTETEEFGGHQQVCIKSY